MAPETDAFRDLCVRARAWIASLADSRRHLALLIALAIGIVLAGCRSSRLRTPAAGNANLGKFTIIRMGCGSCHAIPGIEGADGMVGPPLTHFGRRAIVAGLLPNSPDNLAYWVQHPQSVLPGNAMPDSELSDAQARNIAAYLDTLR